MEARATRMEERRRLLHHVEEEDLQLDWVDRLLMRCPNNPIIYDPEFRCPCFTLFFSVLYLSTGGWSGLSKMAKAQFSVRFDKASWSFRTLKNGGESDKDGGGKAFAPPSGGGGLGFWASGGQTLPLLPRVWSLCRWLLGARLFLQIKGRCFSFQLDSIKPHRKCLLCDLSKTKWNF